MFSKESLYINAIKYKTQLKINYKKLSNNDIIETNSSTYIAKDDILGRDIATTINNYASQINNTYVSTLLLQEDTKLLKKNQPRPRNYVLTSLNNDYNLAISKETLFETRNYFEKCGVDYIFSAFHVLNLHIEQNTCNNSLVILLYNNQAFCLVLNSKGEIVFNKRVELTAFEEIKESAFYENEILGQKLYDEVYGLELEETVKNTISEFYSITKNIFIEKVSLLYNLKLASDEQVQKISDELMIDITYHPISVDEELFELSKDTHTHKSFIKPRVKPKGGFKALVFTLIILIILLVAGFLFITNQNSLKRAKITSVETKKVKPVKRKVELPNHIEKNEIVEDRILKSLEMIPYDMVLNELTFEKNSEKMDINLLRKDTFIKVLQPELDKLYSKTTIEYKKSKNHILEAVVNSEGLKDKKVINFKDYKDTYLENEFIPIIRVTEQIKMLFPKDAIVTFKSSFKSEVVTFNYLIDVVVQKPIEFFEMVNNINKELYSINLSYPINFVKTEAGIEIEFLLQFHQPK